MTQEEAFALAIRYIGDKGVTHYGCHSIHILSDFEMHGRSFEVEPDFPRGFRSKVWCFYFALIEPEPNTVVSGGDYVVFIDDETGSCGCTVTI